MENELANEVNPMTEKILDAARAQVRRYGEAKTNVVDIARALGTSHTTIYRHFRSKADLLAAGVLQQIEAVADLTAIVDNPERLRRLSLRERLDILAEAGFRRLDAKRDLSRILHRRDLVMFPDLLEALSDEDLRRVFQSVTHWFEAEAGEDVPKRDWQAIAAVLVGAIAHYWLLRDAIGEHPDGVDEDRYRAVWIEIGLLLLSKQKASDGESNQ